MKKLFFAILLGCCTVWGADSKEKSLDAMRDKEAKTDPQHRWWSRTRIEKYDLDGVSATIRPDGTYADLEEKRRNFMALTDPVERDRGLCLINTLAMDRSWTLALGFRDGKCDAKFLEPMRKTVHLCAESEAKLPTAMPVRWYWSSFDIPTAALNIYWCFYEKMLEVEDGSCKDPQWIRFHQDLRRLAMQAWLLPEETAKKIDSPESLDRFRHNMEWVGGNGMAYRSALHSALMLRSVKKMEILSEASLRTIEPVSWNTAKENFWREGFLADGSGVGVSTDGCYWEYPHTNMLGPLQYGQYFRHGPWNWKLSRKQAELILDFLRGSSFYEYRGLWQPVVVRILPELHTRKPERLVSYFIAWHLLQWPEVLTPEEIAEIKQFRQEMDDHNLFMLNAPEGHYHGTRYFFNSEDLIRKTPEYHCAINMASRRTNGIDSAFHIIAPGYNWFSCDGALWLERSGTEHARAFGAYDWTAFPGVTARQTPEKLIAGNAFQGYCSTQSFAAGVVAKGNAAAGFLQHKTNPIARDRGVADPGDTDPNKTIYGIRAAKSYFFFGETLLALSGGIVNEHPEYEGTIRTTLAQTLLAQDSTSQKGWEINNRFAYRVLPDQTDGILRITRGVRKSNWREIMENPPESEESIPIFQMTVDHGQKIRNGRCAFVVRMNGELDAPLPEVLHNTSALQAAQDPQGAVISAVFYDASAALQTARGTLKVSAPCAVMLHYEADSVTVTAADGEMNPALRSIVVTVPGAGKVEIPVPTGAYCGKAASVKIPLQK